MTVQSTSPAAVAPSVVELRDRLVEHALSRAVVIVRYRFMGNDFLSLVVGKVGMVQTEHVAITMCLRADVRVIPIANIVSVALEPRQRLEEP